MHEQPVGLAVDATGQHGIDHAEACQVDDAGVPPAARAHRLVLLDDVTTHEADDELASTARGRQTWRVGDLRVLDPERRCLPGLPSHQLVEIGRPLRKLLERHQRHLRGGVRHHECHPRRCARQLLQYPAHRLADSGPVSNVRGVGRRCQRPVRQRLGHGGRHLAAPSPAQGESGHVVGRDLDAGGGHARGEQPPTETCQDSHGQARYGPSLHEGHLIDFPQRGHSGQHFLDRRIAQKAHPFGPHHLLDLRSGSLGQNHLP